MFASKPPVYCRMWSWELYPSFSTREALPFPRELPQMSQGSQVSASAQPKEARPVPLAFTSVVFISVFSLSHCAGPRVWGEAVLYKSN